MNRVELKEKRFYALSERGSVPNEPCGVERSTAFVIVIASFLVPNEPCGVESSPWEGEALDFLCVPNEPCGVERLTLFPSESISPAVPNEPCGVESEKSNFCKASQQQFLMNRVELKGTKISTVAFFLKKVPNEPCGVERGAFAAWLASQLHVPNEPCGVERGPEGLSLLYSFNFSS